MTSADVTPFGALAGLKIIDLTQMLAGPYGTMFFADHGASVIRVEPPEGENLRGLGPFLPEDHERVLGAYFQSVNRNKSSVCLDLKTEAGKAALKAMVADADAVVENFREGVMDRLGLGYEELKKVNRRLVYGALRGFGDRRTGASPYVDWPAYDVVAQAMGGIMAITGPDAETPTKIGPGVGDLVPGLMLAFGVLAAIHHARQAGEGQFVDVSMVDAILSICERSVWQRTVQGLTPAPEGNHHPLIAPFGMFPASDGFVAVAAQADGFFRTFCEKIDAPDLAEDLRFASGDGRRANRLAVISEVSARTRKFSKAELIDRLGGQVPFGPVLNMAEIEQNPHFAAREMIVEVDQPGARSIRVAGVPIKMTGTPGGVRRRSPLPGEHTVEVLRQAGLSDEEIQMIVRGREAGTRAEREPVQS